MSLKSGENFVTIFSDTEATGNNLYLNSSVCLTLGDKNTNVRCVTVWVRQRANSFSEIYMRNKKDKKLWEEIIAYFPLIRHGPQRKGRHQQFFNCCVCIRYSGNVFTEPLPRNDSGYTYRHRN
jgi:hypothetical protein